MTRSIQRSHSHAGGRVQTLDDFECTYGPSWGADIASLEKCKRRGIHEEHLGQELGGVRIQAGTFKNQERVFDPLLQRYRDPRVEHRERLGEERGRVHHLNRAQDLEVLRTQQYNIVNHTDKLHGVAEPKRTPSWAPGGSGEQTQAGRSGTYPTSLVDYNIVSNLSTDVHHWTRPQDRPHITGKTPGKAREMPAWTQKDFHLISNRYLENHDSRTNRDRQLNLLEATDKLRNHRMLGKRQDPLTGVLTDARDEENFRTYDVAHELECADTAKNYVPLCIRGRESAGYDLISHKTLDQAHLQMIDAADDRRADGYRNRHIIEHNLHLQDVKRDHIEECRKIGRVAPERFEDNERRGFDVITNQRYGAGPRNAKTLFEGFVNSRLTPWQRATLGRSSSTPSHIGVPTPSIGASDKSVPTRSGRGTPSRSAELSAQPSASATFSPLPPGFTAMPRSAPRVAASSCSERRGGGSPAISLRPSDTQPPMRHAKSVPSISSAGAPPPPKIHCGQSGCGSVYSQPTK